MQSRYKPGGYRAPGIYIALKVSPDDDPTLSKFQPTLQYLCLSSRINLRQYQGCCPADSRVTRRITPILAKIHIILGCRCRLFKYHKGALSHVALFGCTSAEIARILFHTLYQLYDLRRILRRQCITECLAECCIHPDRVLKIGIPDCLYTSGSRALRLAPFIACHIILICRRPFDRGGSQ